MRGFFAEKSGSCKKRDVSDMDHASCRACRYLQKHGKYACQSRKNGAYCDLAHIKFFIGCGNGVFHSIISFGYKYAEDYVNCQYNMINVVF